MDGSKVGLGGWVGVQMKDFLLFAGWHDAEHAPVAGDASSRQYTRLTQGGESAILMQDPEGDVANFARIAEYLLRVGLSAPKILARDVGKGLLLIEDLGTNLFADLLKTSLEQEEELYRLATDVLLHLHQQTPPELPIASIDHLSGITDIAFDSYLTGAGGDANDAAKADLQTAISDALSAHAPIADVVILRDYHAENLLWLPDRDGVHQAGILDFQDALVGHRAYDLVSLLEDARRDVSDATRAATVRHFAENTGQSVSGIETQMAVLGAQRNLRILGVFARLARVRGKPQYVDLIPRVWGHLRRDLSHSALSDVKKIVDQSLPTPSETVLKRLKADV